MLISYLCREAAELEAWISEKETVAASEDIGRDLEHVEVSVYVCAFTAHMCNIIIILSKIVDSM